MENKYYIPRQIQCIGTIIGTFFIQLTLGAAYTFSGSGEIIYLSRSTNINLDIPTLQKTMWIFGFAMFGLSASMSFAGYIENILGTRNTILYGSWFMSIGVLTTALSLKENIVILVITYGMVCGLGAGMVYGMSLAVVCQWFKRHPGLILAVVGSGFSFGPVLLQFIKKCSHDNYLGKNYFLINGIIFIIIQLIASIMIKRPQNEVFVTVDNPIILSTDEWEVNVAPHTLIFEYDFWIIWITFALNCVGVIMITRLHGIFELLNFQNFPNFQTKYSYLVYVYAILGALGRIICGYSIDIFSYKYVMTVMTMGSCFLHAIGVVLVQMYKTTNVDYNLYAIVLSIYYFWLSGNHTLFPAIIVKRFGQKYFAQNFGLIMTAYTFIGILSSICIVYISETIGKVLCLFILLAVLSFIAFLLTQAYLGLSLRFNRILFFNSMH